jgi:hypothetical protein
MGDPSGRVVIGMDPHKRSVTIEVMAGDETVLGTGRFDTNGDGYAAMLAYATAWPQRVWAIEAVRALAGTWRTGYSSMVSRWWTCRRSCRLGRGCSRPGRAARPTLPTPTRSL